MPERVSGLGVVMLFIGGCAAVNPNPNVGMRSADAAFSRGDCKGAMDIARPAALRGEPWAQLRMGLLLVDKKCPSPPKDKRSELVKEALNWWMKAACYRSTTAWERGNELAIGESGYFNARASSTNAANFLAVSFNRNRLPGVSWLWINHAIQQYDADEPDRHSLLGILGKIESALTAEQVTKLKDFERDPCTGVRS